MRNIFISVLCLCTLIGCAKKDGAATQGKATFLSSYTLQPYTGPCAIFNSGAKLVKIERTSMAGSDVQVYTEGYSPDQPIQHSTMAGLLLTFDQGQPFLLQILRKDMKEPSESDFMTAINQITLLNTNSKTIKVECDSSTPYFTKGDLSGLRYMNRFWVEKPEEGSQSNVDGSIIIENVGF